MRDKSANLNRFVAMVRDEAIPVSPLYQNFVKCHSMRGAPHDFGKACFEQGVGIEELRILGVVFLSALTKVLKDCEYVFQRHSRNQVFEAWESRLNVVVNQMVEGAELAGKERSRHGSLRAWSSLREGSARSSFKEGSPTLSYNLNIHTHRSYNL